MRLSLTLVTLCTLVTLASACSADSARLASSEEREDDQPRTGDLCPEQGAAASCGDSGAIFCDAMSDETDLQWGPCIAEDDLECEAGEVVLDCAQGEVVCGLFGGVPALDDTTCEQDAGNGTPLVLRFDDAPIRYTEMVATGFDIDGLGQCDAYDWPEPQTPWLALDRDHDGIIGSGAELFGSGSVLLDGHHAAQGFEALAELDSDGDGAITRADARWDELRLWSDHDADRVGVAGELDDLGSRNLVRIDLSFAIDRVCDVRGNCEVETARFTYVDELGRERSGDIVDVHLACQ